MKYTIAKGVFDILPKDPDPHGGWRSSHLWQFVEQTARTLCQTYALQEIRTPIFEMTELFTRGIGETSDIVSKEMYTFHDKANRSLTLRPEGTAPVIRSFIENHLSQQQHVHKFFYLLPMFRYERQQLGRYRQHHQFGVEIIGNPGPYQDVEIMALLLHFYEKVGLKDFILHINSLGTGEARTKFKNALREYLKEHFESLSEESKVRYHTNCLRILDSKDPKDRELCQKAPTLFEFLDEESKNHFATVCHLLDELGIEYKIDASLVRGLDYYNHTVFEVTSNALGAQNALGGGGRYDGLIKELGGPDLASVGFGTGVERVIQSLLAQKAPLPLPTQSQLLFIPLGEAAKEWAFKMLYQLRQKEIAAEMDFSTKKLAQKMRTASSSGAIFTAVVGDEELAKKQLILKEMATGKQEIVAMNHLIERIQRGK